VSIDLGVDEANRHTCERIRETIEYIPAKRLQQTPDTPRGICLKKAMTWTKSVHSSPSLDALHLSELGGKRPKP